MRVKVCVVLVLLAFLVVTASFAAEEVQKTSITQIKSFWCAVLDGQGSYQNMENTIVAFMTEFFKQGLQPAGPMMSIYFNPPTETDEKELKWAIGFQVAADTTVNLPLRLIEFKDHQAAVYLHVGPYDQLGAAHTAVTAFATQKGFKAAGPLYEKYLNNPMETAPDKLETQIVMPVEAK